MGNACKKGSNDPDSDWKQQNKESKRNLVYRFADLTKGGKLIESYKTGGVSAVEDVAKKEIEPYLYDGGNGTKLTKVDWIKWLNKSEAKKKGYNIHEIRSDYEIENEYQEDKFNIFSDHEVCWDIDKRGGVGETPIHLLYLMDSASHTAVANTLLKIYPKMSVDIYEGHEYYGESALHIAIVYGDFESVKLLIESGANVNQRATGRFFLPEDMKSGKSITTTNYEGYAYYGEYPLAFAASFGRIEIYDYLIDQGADPNYQDSFGNTVLHMVVIQNQVKMYKYIVKHKKCPGDAGKENFAKLTPMTLANKLGRHQIFNEMLELSAIEFWRYSNVVCSAYPLAALDSIGPDGDTNWNSALMIVINGETDDHLEMLEGVVLKHLLDEKWKTFARRRFLWRLVQTLLHLTLISVAIYTRPSENLLSYTEPKDIIRFICEILVCLFCIVILVMEAVEIGSQGLLGFLKNCRHAPTNTIFMISCILVLLCIPFRFSQLQAVEDVFLIIAVPGIWFFLLFFARSVQLTGPFVTMIYQMLVGDLFRFGIIYVIFLTGFTQGFYFLFRDIEIEENSFSSLQDTLMTLFQMTLGEFKYHDFDLTRYPLLTKLVFAVFMILVPILLLNMLIAMMGNTYTQVIAKSEKEWRRQWAKIVVVLERGFSKKQLLKYQKEYAVGDKPSIVVIKTNNKTSAFQSMKAVSNWKRAAREIIDQIKQQKRAGVTGPLELKRSQRNCRKTGRTNSMSSNSSSDEDTAPLFSSITEQLAWEKDIDLTKGQAFVNDPTVIAKHSPRSPGEQLTTKPRTTPKLVKTPQGNPKTSPKGTRSVVANRVHPLGYPKQSVSTDDSGSERDLLKGSTNRQTPTEAPSGGPVTSHNVSTVTKGKVGSGSTRSQSQDSLVKGKVLSGTKQSHFEDSVLSHGTRPRGPVLKWSGHSKSIEIEVESSSSSMTSLTNISSDREVLIKPNKESEL